MRYLTTTLVKITHGRDDSALSGSNLLDKRNNLYDLEGSRFEWTQEASENDDRAIRGGYFDVLNEVSWRAYTGWGTVHDLSYISTRPTLYIK